MIVSASAALHAGELEEIVNCGNPPISLKSANENAATFELSLDTEMIVVPTINRWEAFPFPTVGISPGAVLAIEIEIPLEKVRSLLLVQ